MLSRNSVWFVVGCVGLFLVCMWLGSMNGLVYKVVVMVMSVMLL